MKRPENVENALLDWKQVKELVRFSRTHVWRLLKKGEFPQPVRFGTRRVLWRWSDITCWIEGKWRPAVGH